VKLKYISSFTFNVNYIINNLGGIKMNKTKKIKIPFMSNKNVLEYYKTIRPIKTFDGKPFYLRELTNQEITNFGSIRFEINFEEIIDFGFAWIENLKGQKFDANTLTILKDVQMLHKFDSPGFLIPSVKEVISQIPKKLLEQVVAFEIIKKPVEVHDFRFHPNEYKAGFYVCTVRLYSKKVS